MVEFGKLRAELKRLPGVLRGNDLTGCALRASVVDADAEIGERVLGLGKLPIAYL